MTWQLIIAPSDSRQCKTPPIASPKTLQGIALSLSKCPAADVSMAGTRNTLHRSVAVCYSVYPLPRVGRGDSRTLYSPLSSQIPPSRVLPPLWFLAVLQFILCFFWKSCVLTIFSQPLLLSSHSTDLDIFKLILTSQSQSASQPSWWKVIRKVKVWARHLLSTGWGEGGMSNHCYYHRTHSSISFSAFQ